MLMRSNTVLVCSSTHTERDTCYALTSLQSEPRPSALHLQDYHFPSSLSLSGALLMTHDTQTAWFTFARVERLHAGHGQERERTLEVLSVSRQRSSTDFFCRLIPARRATALTFSHVLRSPLAFLFQLVTLRRLTEWESPPRPPPPQVRAALQNNTSAHWCVCGSVRYQE